MGAPQVFTQMRQLIAPPSAAARVDEAMVERYLNAYSCSKGTVHEAVFAGLTAALKEPE
jgi:hypothetical protein